MVSFFSPGVSELAPRKCPFFSPILRDRAFLALYPLNSPPLLSSYRSCTVLLSTKDLSRLLVPRASAHSPMSFLPEKIVPLPVLSHAEPCPHSSPRLVEDPRALPPVFLNKPCSLFTTTPSSPIQHFLFNRPVY